ncbi:hormogonium polysaccharide biosynthesis glycosyltransferase HpsE [Myxacorys almedinensis]|uniref:Glycosyltransferase n=1 Tax=Myxacorys almedinensis A TaxID=2690445 RepID=A0A8J7Z1Z6_9CYAN|nr:hormogonium polysaccharide biosynthesis glycosyltransferase HpsE [Myxacorys almedinensis]NDJ16696.1 glycosyltransferase [Myxacorys almedinensis A]
MSCSTDRLDFTVAIRSYNSADKLLAILEQLRLQSHVESICWEIVIVDNNSTDNTAEIVKQYQSDWHQPWELRYIFEPKQGAAIARRRAIEEAKGTLIGFLDDDNIPTLTWVAAAYTFGQQHPKAGAYGSRILPQYEVEPPQNFDRIAHYLPTMERKDSFRYDSHKRGLPVGAGLVIRRQVWLDQVSPHQIVQGPVGNGFALKGEETEALSHIKLANWEIWYAPDMTIVHQIPRWRLERSYLLNFFRTIGLSQHRFRMLRFQPWQRPIAFPLLLVNDLRKISLYFLKHRTILSTDLVTACEMQFFLGRLFSPFYIWAHLITKSK